METLKNLLYTKDHEWVKADGNKAYVGITDYAQHALGDVVYVELPEIDSDINEGENFGTIESVKAASDAFMPVSGKIVEINEAIVDEPALLNENPYDNWMICVELSNASELEGLMKAEEYEDFASKEA